MAWLDDRIWCHPKVTDLTDAAFRTYINGVAYSSGFDTSGVLTAGQQKSIGSTPRVRTELVQAALWDDIGDNTVRVHDWDEHNGRRDARRRADRERKRAERQKSPRASAGQSSGQSAGTSLGRSTGHSADKAADRRTLKGDRVKEEEQRALPAHDDEPLVDTNEKPSLESLTPPLREIA